MTISIHRFCLVLLFICFAISAGFAAAQTYPTKPIRVILPFPPGGSTDAVLRQLAPRLSDSLGQQVIIDNRPGGATMIAMELVAKSAPDGYMVGVVTLTYVVNPSLFSKIPYNSEKDFARVSLVTIVPLVLTVHPSVPARSVKELIALAKAKPGVLNYASYGNGSAAQMAMEQFKYLTGTNMVHVPFGANINPLLAVLSGENSLIYASIAATLPHIQTGKLVALGVSAAKRVSTVPDIPTMVEAGVPGYEAVEFQGIVVPAGTPSAVINRLNQEFVKALKAPDMKERLENIGAYAVGNTPEEFENYIKKESATWSKVIKAAGIHFD